MGSVEKNLGDDPDRHERASQLTLPVTPLAMISMSVEASNRRVKNRWTVDVSYWHNLGNGVRLWCSGSTRAFQALRASSSLVSRSNCVNPFQGLANLFMPYKHPCQFVECTAVNTAIKVYPSGLPLQVT